MTHRVMLVLILVGAFSMASSGAGRKAVASKPMISKSVISKPVISKPGVQGGAATSSEQKRLLKRTFGFTILTLQSEALGLEIAQRAKDMGGYLKSLSNEALDVVIPIDRVESFARDIAAAGSIASRTESSEDITRQWVDQEAMLRSRQKLLKEQLAALDGVGRIQDLGDIEREITETIEGVESLKGAGRLMQHQLRFAAVHVDFHFRKMDETAAGGSSFRWIDTVDFAPLLQSM